MMSTERLNEVLNNIRADLRSIMCWWLLNMPWSSINDLARVSERDSKMDTG